MLAMEYNWELYSKSRPYLFWATPGVQLGILVVWLPIEISRVYRKERHHNNLCRSCGYDVRKLTADRCPECGCPDLAEGRAQLERIHGFLWIGLIFRSWVRRRAEQGVNG